MRALKAIALGMGLTFAAAAAPAVATDLNVAGIFSSQKNYQVVEQAFFESLASESGVDITLSYHPVDQLGVKARDLLRLVGSGAFDVMIVGVPIVAGDHPFLEGLDVAGVAPTPDGVVDAIAAYKPIMNDLLESEFNTRVIALWHFAPMQLFCRDPIESAADLQGKKVRTFTTSQARLLSELGAVPVDMNFAEVYTAIQRSVLDCAVTDSTGANGSKIAEVVGYHTALSVSQMVAGYFINLDKWNSFTDDEKERLDAAFARLEELMKARSVELAEDASNCNVGAEPCTLHDPYNLTRIEPTQAFLDEVEAAAARSSLPMWVAECNERMPGCSQTWNELFGSHIGVQAE